jgi:hypothetical protein
MAAENLLGSCTTIPNASSPTPRAEDALDRARADGWTVVSVKDDWGTVFAGQ